MRRACPNSQAGGRRHAQIRDRTGHSRSRKTAEAGVTSHLAEIMQRLAKHGSENSMGPELRHR